MPVTERLAEIAQPKGGEAGCGISCAVCPAAAAGGCPRQGAINPESFTPKFVININKISEMITEGGILRSAHFTFKASERSGGGGPSPSETSKTCSKCEKPSTSCTCSSK